MLKLFYIEKCKVQNTLAPRLYWDFVVDVDLSHMIHTSRF